MGLDFSASGHENEHEALTKILNSVIPEVSRDLVFGEHEQYGDVEPERISDKSILNAVEWNGPYKRRQKWLLMSGEMVFQAEHQRKRQSLKSEGDEKSRYELASSSPEAGDVNWQDCYNEAADAVAIYVDGASSAEAIKDGLRRQTFGDEISITIPREVLRRLVGRVHHRENPTVDEVIAAHQEAVESL